MTLKQALQLCDERITRREILLLLEKSTKMSLTSLRLLEPDRILPGEAVFFELLEKRRQNMPLQYILGEWEFMGLTFRCTPDCLIPRGDTEVLAEAVRGYVCGLSGAILAERRDTACRVRELPRLRSDMARHVPTKTPPEECVPRVKILELCTGSGCIAIALAHHGKNLSVTATDISPEALKIAQENAALNGVSRKVEFLCCDLFPENRAEYDIIVSNPPYIATGELDALLQNDISLGYEPRMALDGGRDGLHFYRRIARDAGNFLKPGGAVFLEIGCGQAAAVCGLMEACGYGGVGVVKDLAGLDRVVRACQTPKTTL